jgi:hypothetical protein
MKAIFFALFSLAASALATPIIAERQLEAQADEIDQLTELIKVHTANISTPPLPAPTPPLLPLSQHPPLQKPNHPLTTPTNPDATNAAAPSNPSLAEQNAAATAMAPDFEAITAALTSASTTLAKRAWAARSDGGSGNKACPHDCLLTKIQLLVWEIACTLKVVVVKLGLGKYLPTRPYVLRRGVDG